MAIRPQHLSKAPIVEAIIGFTFKSPQTENDALIESFYTAIKSDYPERTPVSLAQFTVNEQGTSGGSQKVGARFVSSDGKRVCLVDRTSFLCSRLAPYESWESLKAEFVRLWSIYSPLARVEVAKVGLRYINKIFLPEGKDMSLSLRTRPEIAEDLPQNMVSFFVRLETVIPEPNGVLIITEAKLPLEKPGYVTAALDHDLQFRVDPESGDIWALMEKARDLKNQYFFASLSDDMLKEYI